MCQRVDGDTCEEQGLRLDRLDIGEVLATRWSCDRVVVTRPLLLLGRSVSRAIRSTMARSCSCRATWTPSDGVRIGRRRAPGFGLWQSLVCPWRRSRQRTQPHNRLPIQFELIFLRRRITSSEPNETIAAEAGRRSAAGTSGVAAARTV